jgi:hypothetical protein
MVSVSPAELRALVTGEIIVAFVPRATVTEGDEVELVAGAPLPPEELKPAYRRWADAAPPTESHTGVVVGVVPAAILDPLAGAARHVRETAGEGDLVLMRVYGPDGPVLDDDAFEARRRSVEGALIR